MRISLQTVRQKIGLAVVLGFLLGAIWLVALRFFTYINPNTHYHGNFALYINGQRDELSSFTFYEEVQSCGSDEVNNPKTRVHLHDSINHVVHVHDPAATWGHLFANLGYTLGDTLVKTDNGVFVEGSSARLTFILNGKEVDGVANRTIRSEDALLINYGNEDAATLQQRYDAIAKDAAEYNLRNDPSACTGTKPASNWEKFKESIGV